MNNVSQCMRCNNGEKRNGVRDDSCESCVRKVMLANERVFRIDDLANNFTHSFHLASDAKTNKTKKKKFCCKDFTVENLNHIATLYYT